MQPAISTQDGSAVSQLFDACDVNKDGALDFQEVARLFKQLSPEQSTASANNAAVEALLIADRNIDTRLNRQEFELLLLKVCDAANASLPDAAGKLLNLLQQSRSHQDTAAPSTSQAAVTIVHQAAARESGRSADATPSQQGVSDHEKLLALFELWDKVGDGSISFSELCQGLAKFKPISGKQDMMATLTEAAGVIAKHDADADRRLDFLEFGAFMTRFMAAAGYRLQDVLDQLITLAATKPDNPKLQQVLDKAKPLINQLLYGKRQEEAAIAAAHRQPTDV